jgi:hypothetical protein
MVIVVIAVERRADEPPIAKAFCFLGLFGWDWFNYIFHGITCSTRFLPRATTGVAEIVDFEGVN